LVNDRLGQVTAAHKLFRRNARELGLVAAFALSNSTGGLSADHVCDITVNKLQSARSFVADKDISLVGSHKRVAVVNAVRIEKLKLLVDNQPKRRARVATRARARKTGYAARGILFDRTKRPVA
jgi:hypothetical protein